MHTSLLVIAALLVFTSGVLLKGYQWRDPQMYALAALLGLEVAAGCATLRPQIQEARDDVVLACRKLTAAMVGDVSPSRAERIAQKVCLAETFAEVIAKEAVADEDQLFSETLPIETRPIDPDLAPLPAALGDAGAAR